jgi:putative ABC transport system permease protein
VILAGFGLITLLVSLLSMFNTLTISLMERTKEVALMKIMGMRKINVRGIFLTESIILGISGGVVGILFGLICSEAVNLVLAKLAIKAGGETVSVFYYPLGLVVCIFAVSFILGVVTGLYPARRAAKIDSLEALRYE